MASKAMDPDRFQSRDIKRRVSQNERDIARIERRLKKLHETVVEYVLDAHDEQKMEDDQQ